MIDGSQEVPPRRAPALDPREPPQAAPPPPLAAAHEVAVARGQARDPERELAPPGLAWRRMVRWYEPAIVLGNAKGVVRQWLGKYERIPQAWPADEPPRYFDYRAHGGLDRDGALWLDYVSDTGDGWDSTYTVARGIGAARLAAGGPPGAGDVAELPRAQVLVFGGDEVYPFGSARSYRERLLAPYAAAIRDLADDAPHPDVFAVPGNHDWFDGLRAFSGTFISQEWFAHWHALQNRSYFALRLPGRWWLLGMDGKLTGDDREEQLAYFEAIASCMDEGDRVILCHAEPHWIERAITGDPDRDRDRDRDGRDGPAARLAELEARVLKDRTWVDLAGDLHHYRRHSARDGRHRITAGGGGAFAHPTHTNLRRLATITEQVVDAHGRTHTRDYELAPQSCFPPSRCSRRIVLQNALPLGAVWHQPLFFLVPAALYLLTSWMLPLELLRWLGGGAASLHPIQIAGAAVWTGLILAAFLAVTKVEPRSLRIGAALVHALAHLAAVFLCTWLATRWATALEPGGTAATRAVRDLIVLGLGGLIGSTIFGWYLASMCELFDAHENGAASTQGCSHWKSFLRLRIAADGELTIHPIGIARTPRWATRGYRPGAGPAVPRDGRPDHEIYRHIEPPIVVPARPRPGSGAPS